MARKDLGGYLKIVPTTIPKYHVVPLQVGASTVLSPDYEKPAASDKWSTW